MQKESEKRTERNYLRDAVKRLGGISVKGNAYNNKGFPDRIILLPGSKAAFLELKSEGKKPTKIQAHWIKKLQGLGFHAGYADSKKMVDEFLREMFDENKD